MKENVGTGSSPAGWGRPGVITALTLNNLRLRSYVFQLLVMVGVAAVGWYLVTTTQRNLDLRGIATGFGFLGREAGMPIAESLIPYTPADSYGRALIVGLLNTLKVAAIGIVLATLWGTVLGIAQLSKNWLLSRLAAAYVELIRDVPLLLQLLLWYSVLQGLPAARDSLAPLPGVFLSNRGLYIPSVDLSSGHWLAAGLLLVGILALMRGLVARSSKVPKISRSGRAWLAGGVIAALVAVTAFAIAGLPTIALPALAGFNFRGGNQMSPEFFALVFGLVAYTAAFIAEIVRAGISSVAQGQWEAGLALGLNRSSILRKIVMPQALRVIIPPLTSQYLNLTKNSSLAVAIGYQDIVSIANTTLNQTGQAIEGIGIIMAVYLSISLSISLLMNWYNAKIQLKVR